MLPVDAWFTPWVLAVAVVLVLAALTARAVRRDRRDYRRFKRLRTTKRRVATLRRWLLESFTTLGGASIVLLAIAWPWVEPALDAGRMLPPVAWLIGAYSGTVGGVGAGIAIGVTIGLVVALVVPILFARRMLGGDAAANEPLPTVGDVSALIPRNRAELPVAAGLSVNAGLVEEALFRFAVPATLFGIATAWTDPSVGAWIAFGGAAVLFGLMHVYQGVSGIVTAVILGVLLTLVYLVSGSIWVAMLVHALFDLRSLVLLPIALGRHRLPPVPAPGTRRRASAR